MMRDVRAMQIDGRIGRRRRHPDAGKTARPALESYETRDAEARIEAVECLRIAHRALMVPGNRGRARVIRGQRSREGAHEAKAPVRGPWAFESLEPELRRPALHHSEMTSRRPKKPNHGSWRNTTGRSICTAGYAAPKASASS